MSTEPTTDHETVHIRIPAENMRRTEGGIYILGGGRKLGPFEEISEVVAPTQTPVSLEPAAEPPNQLGTRWRVGRHVGRTIYAQLGPQPSDDDPLIGVMDTPGLAALAVDAVNEREALTAEVDRLAYLLPVGRMYLDALDADPEHELLTLPEAIMVTAVREVVEKWEAENRG